jgi:hypothetical protein
MTPETRRISGIILITVPTIQYGGYFLLTSLIDRSSGYTDNPSAPESLPGRPRSCRCDRTFSADLSVVGGRGDASPVAVAFPQDRSPVGGDSHFLGLLSVHAFAQCRRAGRRRVAHLSGSRVAGVFGPGPRRRIVTQTGIQLAPDHKPGGGYF